MYTTAYVNLREFSSTNSRILTSVYSGTKVEVLDKASSWYKVRVNNKIGYMYSSYISSRSTSINKDVVSSGNINIKTAVLNTNAYLKAIPHNDSYNKGYLSKGTEVTVLDDSGYFVKVAYGNKVGYIFDKYLKLNRQTIRTPKSSPIIQDATGTKVTTAYVNFRIGPGVQNKSLGVIPINTKVDVLGLSNGWSKITWNGRIGFVSNNYLKGISDKNIVVSKTISTPIESNYTKPVYSKVKAGSILTGYETESSNIKVQGLSSSYRNNNILVKGYISGSSASNVFVYLNNHLQGTAYSDGTNYSYTIRSNSTKPGLNKVTIKAVYPNGKQFITSRQININKTPVIVVDAGHGGHDPGAVSYALGDVRQEKNSTLSISKNLKYNLENMGFKVILTRSDDRFLPLTSRAQIANSYNADFFISVHHNAAGTSRANGAFSAYPSEKSNPVSQGVYSESQVIANYLQNAYAKNGLKTIPVTRDVDYTGYSYSVLRNTQMKSLLTEIGFLTNPNDESKIINPSFQRNVAKSMAQELYRYFYRR